MHRDDDNQKVVCKNTEADENNKNADNTAEPLKKENLSIDDILTSKLGQTKQEETSAE